MNVYSEVGSGGLYSNGCAVVCWHRPLVTAFRVGDAAYRKDKARRGILEKIIVKLVRPVRPRHIPARNRVIYEDTLHGLWNEDDLVTLTDALALVEAYQTKLAQDRAALPSC